MCALSINNLKEEQDGSTWIKIPRQKTGTIYSIKLLSIPLRIIKKYEKERKSFASALFRMVSPPSWKAGWSKTGVGHAKVQLDCEETFERLEIYSMGRESWK